MTTYSYTRFLTIFKGILIRHGINDLMLAISGPLPVVTGHAKLFVNLSVVATSSIVFFSPKDLKRS
jgi:hypothetical protein